MLIAEWTQGKLKSRTNENSQVWVENSYNTIIAREYMKDHILKLPRKM